VVTIATYTFSLNFLNILGKKIARLRLLCECVLCVYGTGMYVHMCKGCLQEDTILPGTVNSEA